MMSRRRKIIRDWQRIRNNSRDSIGFTHKWANDLNNALIKHKDDDPFIMDLLESAITYWSEEMSEEEKIDSFVFILGILSRR